MFVAGDNEYNIVWVTNEISAAFVELTADGTTYVYRDEKNGVIRTDDYIHTVRVPRAVLESAGKYTVISRLFTSVLWSAVIQDLSQLSVRLKAISRLKIL